MEGILTPYGLEATVNFLPTFINGCVLWLDASRISGLADGAAVTTWSDLSGSGNDATQAVALNKPTYKTGIVAGKPVVRFNGSSNSLATAAFTLNQPETAIVVVDTTNLADGRYILDGGGINQMVMYRSVANLKIYAGAAGITIALPTGWNILSAIFNGASSSLIKNGVATTGNVGTANAGGVMIGGWSGNEARVDIAELIVFNRALTAGELNRLHLYLGRKYSIGVS